MGGDERVQSEIRAGYPGGNIEVVEKGRKRIRLRQTMRDTMSWWFYWCFTLESDRDGKYTFEFTDGEVLGPWGPAISRDGERWMWLGAESLHSRSSFSYVARRGETVRFAFALPYWPVQLERFLGVWQESECLYRRPLVQSEGGATVPLLLVGNPAARRQLLCTCRHHACESMANYVLEGLLGRLIDDGRDGGETAGFLEENLLVVIPFVDLDGVLAGDQGKNRFPHDHNRDYITSPLYAANHAIMALGESLDLRATLDFHCPYKWGGRNDRCFFVRQPSPSREGAVKLAVELESLTDREHTFRYEPGYDLDPGQEWHLPGKPSFGNFFYELGVPLVFCLEFPYFGTEGNPVTVRRARNLGGSLARALARCVD